MIFDSAVVARIRSLLVLGMLLVGMGAPRGVAYLCSMTGEVQPECCCRGETAVLQVQADTNCCNLIAPSDGLPEAAPGTAPQLESVAVTALPPFEQVVAAPVRAPVGWTARGRPPDIPPLRASCILLI